MHEKDNKSVDIYIYIYIKVSISYPLLVNTRWLSQDFDRTPILISSVVKDKKWELIQEQKDTVNAIPFPNSLKAMESFLGMVGVIL